MNDAATSLAAGGISQSRLVQPVAGPEAAAK